VEAVGGGDLVALAARADAGNAERDDLAVADDGGGHAGDVMLLDDGDEDRGDILRRRGRGVDGDGSEAEDRESDGENGFHRRGSWLGYHAHRRRASVVPIVMGCAAVAMARLILIKMIGMLLIM
jgi:hypothetical protein